MKIGLNPWKKTIAVVFCSVALNLSSQVPCVNFASLHEDILELSDFMKDYSDVSLELTKFLDRTRRYDGETFHQLSGDAYVVNMKAVKQLLDLLPSTNCSADVRAMKVVFGMENNVIRFFFAPIIMTRVIGTTTGTCTYSVANVTPPTYKYDSGTKTMVQLNASDYASITYYEEHMRIKRHFASTDFSPLNLDGEEWRRDTREVIFSFQEIFHLYDQNYCTGGTSSYDKDLYFYNGLAKYFDSRINIRRWKHTAFIAVEDIHNLKSESKITVKKVLTAIYEKAANLAHLCPPSCNPVYLVKTLNDCHL